MQQQLVIGLSLFEEVAGAQSVEWPTSEGGNGHAYELVTELSSWDQAEAGAAARGGYLATITGPEEQDFIQNNVLVENEDLTHAWIGGYQDLEAPDYVEPGGGWRWLTGETWGFTNWFGTEPSNNGNLEHFLMVYQSPGNFGFWNDDQNGRAAQYVVEYSAPIPTVSEWGLVAMTLLLLIAGSLVFRRRPARAAV